MIYLYRNEGITLPLDPFSVAAGTGLFYLVFISVLFLQIKWVPL